MSFSSAGSPPEKDVNSLSQPPLSPNTTSSTSTLVSRSSLVSFLRLARSGLGFIHSKQKIYDVEDQAEAEDEGVIGPVFNTGGPEGTKVRKLDQCPNGYPRLAAFNASEQNFMLYRGFSCVHARLLLSLQTSISALEAELDKMDGFHSTLDEDEKKRLRSCYLDEAACKEEKVDGDRTRNDILEELRVKVCQYDELLVKARMMVSFQRPSNRDYQSVRNWFHNVKPLIGEEDDYILWKEDIVTLRHGREWAGFDGWVEHMLHKIDCRLVRWIFRTDDLRRKTSDKNVYYFSPSRVSRLVNMAITSVIFVLLVAPVVTMYQLTAMRSSKSIFSAIGVLMVFTLLFAAAMSMLTKARRHELFAASAAYCAVLVVFIGSTANL